MTGHVRVGGTWRDVAGVSVRVGGTWREVSQAWTRVGGVWREWFSGAKGIELITSQTATSNVTSINFTSIPQDYDDLIIMMSALSTTAAQLAGFQMRLNNVSTSNSYTTQIFLREGISYVALPTTAFTGYNSFRAANASSTEWSWNMLRIANYSKADRFTTILHDGGANDANTMQVGGGIFRQNTAVSSIQMLANFRAGTKISLYGIKA